MPKADSKGTRKRRQRGSINSEEIVAGAFEVARRVSLDQLSMPILAEHLDVGVTSIYWYFRRKEELLNAMTEVAVDKYVRLVPEVLAEHSWQDTLTEHFRALRAIHREDEILSDLLLIRTSTYSREATHRILAVAEAVVAKLVAEGFTPDNALMVYNTIGVYSRGSIIHTRILQQANAPTTDTARQRRMTDWSDMPVLDSLIDRHPLSGTSDEDFEFSLDCLLCGFEALLSGQDASSRKASRATKPAARSKTAGRARAVTTRKPSTRKAAS